MSARIDGKVVIVTGAAAGVGRATAELLAGEGGRVVLTDLNESEGLTAAGAIGEQALFVRQDVSSEDDWRRVIGETVARFGRLDGIVNNAAIFPQDDIEATTLAKWQQTHRVNADSVFLGCKYGIAEMKRFGGGSIVNMASAAALQGYPYAAYSGSKGSVTALTRSVAAHCRKSGYRIRCNSVHPGGIVTAMTVEARSQIDAASISFDDNPVTGFADPRDIANLVLFLISDESRYITGAEMRIDNGLISTALF